MENISSALAKTKISPNISDYIGTYNISRLRRARDVDIIIGSLSAIFLIPLYLYALHFNPIPVFSRLLPLPGLPDSNRARFSTDFIWRKCETGNTLKQMFFVRIYIILDWVVKYDTWQHCGTDYNRTSCQISSKGCHSLVFIIR